MKKLNDLSKNMEQIRKIKYESICKETGLADINIVGCVA